MTKALLLLTILVAFASLTLSLSPSRHHTRHPRIHRINPYANIALKGGGDDDARPHISRAVKRDDDARPHISRAVRRDDDSRPIWATRPAYEIYTASYVKPARKVKRAVQNDDEASIAELVARAKNAFRRAKKRSHKAFRREISKGGDDDESAISEAIARAKAGVRRARKSRSTRRDVSKGGDDDLINWQRWRAGAMRALGGLKPLDVANYDDDEKWRIGRTDDDMIGLDRVSSKINKKYYGMWYDNAHSAKPQVVPHLTRKDWGLDDDEFPRMRNLLSLAKVGIKAYKAFKKSRSGDDDEFAGRWGGNHGGDDDEFLRRVVRDDDDDDQILDFLARPFNTFRRWGKKLLKKDSPKDEPQQEESEAVEAEIDFPEVETTAEDDTANYCSIRDDDTNSDVRVRC